MIGFNNVDAARQSNCADCEQCPWPTSAGDTSITATILSHEEMDMMRPVSVALPMLRRPLAFDRAQIRSTGTITRSARHTSGRDHLLPVSPGPVSGPPQLLTSRTNTAHAVWLTETYDGFTDYQYRVVAHNTVGYGLEFLRMTVESVFPPVIVSNPPRAPSNLMPSLPLDLRLRFAGSIIPPTRTGF